MCVQLLHSTKRGSWISLASAGSSQQLRHIQLCVHWRRCVWALLDCTACVCCVCGGSLWCVFSYSMCPRHVKVVLYPRWVVAELQKHWLENVWVRPCLLSVCAENGSMTRWRLWAVEKGKWLASIEIFWHMRQNNWATLSFPHAKKMNYGHYWGCFNMPNCQLPMKNTYWCMNPARCSKCHFTTQWARTSFK